MAERIQKLYTGTRSSGAYSGLATFQKSKESKKYSKAEITQALHTIPAYVLHKPRIKKFERRKIFVPTLNHQFGADLIEIRNPKSNYRKRYILGIVDHFSRSAWLEALSSKNADVVLEAIKKIFKRTKRKPLFFTTDDGKEFTNRKLQAYLKDENIKHFVTSSSTKCAINERFNRTIGQRISRYLTHNNTKRFVHMLPVFEKQYNASYHRTIKSAPKDVTEENSDSIFQNIYGQGKKIYTKKAATFKIGDKVLIPRKKKLFSKGYDINWESDVHTIAEVKRTRPVTYILENSDGNRIKGGWYKEELNKIDNGVMQHGETG